MILCKQQTALTMITNYKQFSLKSSASQELNTTHVYTYDFILSSSNHNENNETVQNKNDTPRKPSNSNDFRIYDNQNLTHY